MLGMVNGAIAGLVTITPACGYVNASGSFFIGTIGGVTCYFSSQLKYLIRVDDALDAFGVHAVGGMTGGILTAFFADKDINGYNGIFYTSTNEGIKQLYQQFYSIVVVSFWAGFVSYILLYFLNYTMGLRVPVQIELDGLDKKFFREELNFMKQFTDDQNSSSPLHLQPESLPSSPIKVSRISTTHSSPRTPFQQITTHYETTNILHQLIGGIDEVNNDNNNDDDGDSSEDFRYNDGDNEFLEEYDLNEETKDFDVLL